MMSSVQYLDFFFVNHSILTPRFRVSLKNFTLLKLRCLIISSSQNIRGKSEKKKFNDHDDDDDDKFLRKFLLPSTSILTKVEREKLNRKVVDCVVEREKRKKN